MVSGIGFFLAIIRRLQAYEQQHHLERDWSVLDYKGRMTGHGFRALGHEQRLKNSLDIAMRLIDRQLAHAAQSMVTRAYDRAQFLPERRKMMQQWSDYLDMVASGGKVIAGNFKKRA
jgi:integrase